MSCLGTLPCAPWAAHCYNHLLWQARYMATSVLITSMLDVFHPVFHIYRLIVGKRACAAGSFLLQDSTACC